MRYYYDVWEAEKNRRYLVLKRDVEQEHRGTYTQKKEPLFYEINLNCHSETAITFKSFREAIGFLKSNIKGLKRIKHPKGWICYSFA